MYPSKRARSADNKPNTLAKRDSLSCQEPDDSEEVVEEKFAVINAVTVVELVTARILARPTTVPPESWIISPKVLALVNTAAPAVNVPMTPAVVPGNVSVALALGLVGFG